MNKYEDPTQRLVSHNWSDEYKENYEKIFGKKETWLERRKREQNMKWIYEEHDPHNNFDDYSCPSCGKSDKWATYVDPNKDKFACNGCGWRPQ